MVVSRIPGIPDVSIITGENTSVRDIPAQKHGRPTYKEKKVSGEPSIPLILAFSLLSAVVETFSPLGGVNGLTLWYLRWS
jgi:hypothetical protein